MENKNKNTIWVIAGILIACAALLLLFFMRKPEEPAKPQLPEISQVEENKEDKEEIFKITPEVLGVEEKIKLQINGEEKVAAFTLGDFMNFFFYLPENEWVEGGYNTWGYKDDSRVSISVYKQLFTDIENDMKCLEADYQYVKLDGYDDVMLLKEDGLCSLVKLVESKEENAVFEINFIYPVTEDGKNNPYETMWQPIADAFKVFDEALLNK